MDSVNPATGETLRSYDETSADEVGECIERAHQQFLAWRETSFEHRGERMRRAAAILRERSDELARLMTEEMGKPISEGRSEAEKCAWVCDYFADHAAGFLAPEDIDSDAQRSYVAFQPLGPVLAIMPWNFPFWQVFRFAAPALMAGNAGLLKHAANVPGCALAIERILADAGFPEGLFSTLLIGREQAARVIEDPRVAAVTLTGSVRAGQKVAAQAGGLVKKTVLELGGSDPYLILEDADLDLAVETCVDSRLINNGQSCIAAKRFIPVEAIRQKFTDRFVEAMRAVEMGDPLREDTRLGPQARVDLRDDLHRQVEASVAAGARLLCGGRVPERPGAWYPATVLVDVAPGQPAYEEELFGPVAAIISAKDEDDAIRIANDSKFGLGAAVFTRDHARGRNIAETRLAAGACFVNELVKSDPRLPFGGIKQSGYGRELSAFGIREFVNIKTVYVA